MGPCLDADCAASGGDNEVQRTMLEIVNQLDGFDSRGNIKVLMATNRPDTLDPALLRPGRLDRKVGLACCAADSDDKYSRIALLHSNDKHSRVTDTHTDILGWLLHSASGTLKHVMIALLHSDDKHSRIALLHSDDKPGRIALLHSDDKHSRTALLHSDDKHGRTALLRSDDKHSRTA